MIQDFDSPNDVNESVEIAGIQTVLSTSSHKYESIDPVSNSRRKICAIFFWMKAMFAFLITLGMLSVMSWRVYGMHVAAVQIKLQQLNVGNSAGAVGAVWVSESPAVPSAAS